jgi:hypothetical protein
MKPFEKFLVSSVGLTRLSEVYLELRQYLQEIGWSEEDVEYPPYFPSKLMRLYDNFGYEQRVLLQQIKDLGLEVDLNDFNKFIEKSIEKINEITPLKDGNHKGRNQGDEDY